MYKKIILQTRFLKKIFMAAKEDIATTAATPAKIFVFFSVSRNFRSVAVSKGLLGEASSLLVFMELKDSFLKTSLDIRLMK